MSKPVARCDTCGQPYKEFDSLYTIASKYDEEGNLTSFRHWKCNEEDGPFARLRKGIAQLRDTARKLEDKL